MEDHLFQGRFRLGAWSFESVGAQWLCIWGLRLLGLVLTCQGYYGMSGHRNTCQLLQKLEKPLFIWKLRP